MGSFKKLLSLSECVYQFSSHHVHTDVRSILDHTDTSLSLCHKCRYFDSYISAGSWHQICPQDILGDRPMKQEDKNQPHDLKIVFMFRFSMIQQICVCVVMSRSLTAFRNEMYNKSVSPFSQRGPVQPRPQVQLPVTESHTPPLLQLQRWTQSAPNQPGGQPEGENTHSN